MSNQLDRMELKLNLILGELGIVIAQEAQLMATADDVITSIQNETTVIGGVKVLVQHLVDVINSNATAQAKLDTMASLLQGNDQTLGEAVQIGTTVP